MKSIEMSEIITFLSDESIDVKNSDLIIRRPYYMKNKCPLRTQSQRLPLITKTQKFKGNDKTEKENTNLPSEESLQSWLKTGVSLPKLTSKDAEGPESGEPFTLSPAGIASSRKFSQVCQRQPVHSPVNLNHFTDSSIGNTLDDYDATNETSVVGASACYQGFKVPSAELLIDDSQVDKHVIQESGALKNWNIWCKRIKSIQDNLKKKTERNECDLVLNSLYNHRKVCEEKELLDIFNKMKQEENYRKIPQPIISKPEESKLEKKRKSEIPVHFIDLPTAIRKEKKLSCDEKKSFDVSKKKSRERKCYFAQVKDQLKVHRADMENLAVIGQSVCPRPPTMKELKVNISNIPKIVIDSPRNDENSLDSDERKSIFCLCINDVEVKFEVGSNIEREPVEDRKRIWKVHFGMCEIGTLTEKIVLVENKGTMAVAYEWMQKKPSQTQTVHPTHHEPWLFFDKNPGIFVPGQKRELKFYLRAHNSGVRSETWYLKTHPSIFPNDRCAKFILTSVVFGDDPNFEVEAVDRYLRKQSGETAVRQFLDELICEIVRPDFGLGYMEYRSLLSEKDIFEHHNPKHYYNSDVVVQLKEIYSEVSCEGQTEWDLSFSTLLHAVRTSALDKSKKEYFLQKMSASAREVLKPCYLKMNSNKKFRQVYQVLCKMVNYMEADYDYQVSCFTLNANEKCTEITECNAALQCCQFEAKSASDETNEINTVNLMRFHLMIYLKVYNRVCQAVEQVAGIIETDRNLSPWIIDDMSAGSTGRIMVRLQ